MTEMLHTTLVTPPILTNTSNLFLVLSSIDHLLLINMNHVTTGINFIVTFRRGAGHSAQVPTVGLYPIAPERVSKVYWL